VAPPAYRLFVDDLARQRRRAIAAQAGLDARSIVATIFLFGGWIIVVGPAAYGHYVIRYTD